MGTFCSYKDCPNIQRSFTKKTFFNLPNDSRREIWIENSGNEQLRGVSSTLRRVFCEDHFEPKYLRRQFNRTTLYRNAVPYPYPHGPKPSEISEKISEAPEIEITEMTESDENSRQSPCEDVIILLNESSNARTYLEKSKQSNANTKHIDTSIARILKINGNSKRKNDELTLDDTDEEVDFVVIESDQQHNEFIAIESNSNSKKKLRSETESTTNRQTESGVNNLASDNEIKNPQTKQDILLSKITNNGIVSSTDAFDANNEETYFALSLLGTMRRLTPHKRAIAKCHILKYLTELEYGSSTIT